MNIIWLIFAHFIGDIALQSPWQADNKGKYWYVMLSHCMIWTTCISVALVYLGLFEYWKVLFLVGGHFVMDEWKSHQPRKSIVEYKDRDKGTAWIDKLLRSGGGTIKSKQRDNWWMIYPDQVWHLIQCVIVYLF